MGQIKDTPLLEYIAQRCKELREVKKVSQEEVYNETEIHIGRIETGKYNVTVSTLKQLCDYFNISLAEFFQNF